jgi:hypothetical protein
MADNDFKFPDEIDAQEVDIEIEIEDDTPPEDRNRQPMPREIVEKLEKADDSEEELDPKAQKERLAQYKKVWNDERRAKESAQREQQEAINLAHRALEDNKRLRQTLSTGEKSYIETVQSSANLELQQAQRLYKDALESGDANAIVEAQTLLNEASYKTQQARQFRPSVVQDFQNDVKLEPVQDTKPKIEPKTQHWLDTNPWYGAKKAMSSFAVGVHEELLDEYGQNIVGTDQYFKRIDKTMREKFPEYFSTLEDEAESKEETQKSFTKARPKVVVAPATRSTSSKQVRLSTSAQAIAKKLGLTNDQYAREQMKLENQ